MAYRKQEEEKKTQRVPLLMKKSDYEKLKKICDMKGMKVSVAINCLCLEYINQNESLLER